MATTKSKRGTPITTNNLTLGIDLGIASIGWALIDKKKRTIESGVRIFREANSVYKNKSKMEDRRINRLARRQTSRRRHRKTRLFHALQNHGLLPGFPFDRALITAIARTELIQSLDRSLGVTHRDGKNFSQALLPYFLRDLGLRKLLTSHELGRCILHLFQRRGYLSNRKSAESANEKKENSRPVLEGIETLSKAMKEVNAATYGSYFYRLGIREPLVVEVDKKYFPERPTMRIRQRSIQRQTVKHEFDLLWKTQEDLGNKFCTIEAYREITNEALFQRPLKSVTKLIGICRFENGRNVRIDEGRVTKKRKRAPRALLEVQDFKLWQDISNIRVQESAVSIPLAAAQAQQLFDKCRCQKSMTASKVAKILGIPMGSLCLPGTQTRPSLSGNLTAHAVQKAAKGLWARLSSQEAQQLVEDLMTIQSDEDLLKRLKGFWQVDDTAATKLMGALETSELQGYSSLSRQAIGRFLPLLANGDNFQQAQAKLYALEKRKPTAKLPAIKDVYPELTNQTVIRTLSELRKLMSAIIAQYGKPQEIRIELARDLKKTRGQRDGIAKQNHLNQGKNKKLNDELETLDERPNRRNRLKLKLLRECDICIYTGRTISPANVFGKSPAVDIDHIVPISRCTEDNFLNMTLCFSHANRDIKGNKTPFEAFGHSENWEDIKNRVEQKIKNPEKRRRFLMTGKELTKFCDQRAARQLTDTAHASKLAAGYLGLLYGLNAETIQQRDATGQRRIYTLPGQLTARLRRCWVNDSAGGHAQDLNSILAGVDSNHKNREDHRHHALDAIVVACTNQNITTQFNSLNAKHWAQDIRYGHHGLTLEAPFDGFHDEVERSLNSFIVYHSSKDTLVGRLHEETFYGMGPNSSPTKQEVSLRKPISSFFDQQDAEGSFVAPKKKDAATIEAKGLIEKIQSSTEVTIENGYLEATDLKNPIRHFNTVSTKNGVVAVGEGHRTRNTKLGLIYQATLFEKITSAGKKESSVEMVKLLDANKRQIAGLPITRPTQENEEEIMTLRRGDMVLLDRKIFEQWKNSEDRWIQRPELTTSFGRALDAARDCIFVVRGFEVDGNRVNLQYHIDASQVKSKSSHLIRMSLIKFLATFRPSKIKLNPLGYIEEQANESNYRHKRESGGTQSQ